MAEQRPSHTPERGSDPDAHFLSGSADEDELELIEMHLLTCENCLAKLEQIEGPLESVKIALNECKAARWLLRRTWVKENFPKKEIEEIQRVAVDVFEDLAKATKWLKRPNLATNNKPPISLVGTPEGYEHVRELLMHIEYGNLA